MEDFKLEQAGGFLNCRLRGYVSEEVLPHISKLIVKESLFVKVEEFNPIEYVSTTLDYVIQGCCLFKPRIDPYGLKYAFYKRVGSKPPIPDYHRFYSKLRNFVHKFCCAHLTPLNEVMSFEEWLAHSKYSQRKKDKFRELSSKYGPERVLNAVVKFFPKDEFYETEKAIRGINSRDDHSKTVLGPIFKSIEEQVFKLPFFVKNLTEQERVEKLNLLFGVEECYVTDYSAFETHFTREMMNNCEMIMYKYMLKNFPTLYRFVQESLTSRNRIYGKHVKASIEATRMSGECNTSLGNGFSNAMFMLFFCHEHGIKVGNFVVEGDDGLFQLSREITPEEFKHFGLNLKIQRTTAPLSEFCGCVYNPQTLTNFGRALKHVVSLGWSPKRYMVASSKRKRELAVARAYSFNATTPGVPILSVLCNTIVERFGRITYARAMKHLKNQWRRPEKLVEHSPLPNELDREYFYHVFGVSVAEQLQIEDDIVRGFPYINSPTLEAVVPDEWRRAWVEYVEWAY